MTTIDGVTLIKAGDSVLRAHRERPDGFEPQTRAVWRALALKDGGTFIDAGAYTGFYSILASINGADRVMAFEPNVGVLHRLLLNLEENGADNVSVHPHALSRVSGERFQVRGINAMSSAATIDGDGSIIGSASTLALDDLELRQVTAIKIDVERHEFDVLLGAERTIKRCRPRILVELLGDVERVDRLLTDWGYTRRMLDASMFDYH